MNATLIGKGGPMNEQDEQRSREVWKQLEDAQQLDYGGETLNRPELEALLAAAFAAVRREGFRSALEKVADNFSEQYKRGDINVTEVQAFLDTRIVHYPEASAAIRGSQKG